MGLHYMHIKMNKAVRELLLDAFDEILFCKKRQKDVRGTAFIQKDSIPTCFTKFLSVFPILSEKIQPRRF
jgi:hypothetical protein